MGKGMNKHEVTCCIKWFIFGFNIFIWLLGCAILSVGLWALAEKDTFSNLGSMTGIPVDPALICILAGAVMFIIGFCGCLGALRESRGLLMAFIVMVGIILLFEITIAILLFLYRSWVESQLSDKMKVMIVQYRDDPDLQNLIDWVQSDWLKCCGVTAYTDWEMNVYFNCSSPGVEACGVPYSCCKDTGALILDTQCGYDMLLNTTASADRDAAIYTGGCLEAGKDWIDGNTIPLASVAITLAFLQVLGIAFACKLRSDIERCEMMA